MTFTQKLFSFQGRLRRQDFWICTLLLWVASFVVSTIVMTIMGGGLMAASVAASSADPNDPAAALRLFAAMGPTFGVLCLFSLALLWPNLAICIKRLHDRGQTGWLVLLFFIPIVNFFFWLINLGILDGTPGSNQYGPSPKRLGEGVVAA